MNSIPLTAPEIQNQTILGAAIDEIRDLVSRPGGLSEMNAIERMESQLARFAGYRFAVGVASGSTALEISLRSLDLEPHSEVITPALSYGATAQAVLTNGLTPVLADVDPLTGCITEKTVRAVLTPRVRAVIAVDLGGRQVAELRRLCQRQGLYLIEDGALALGVPNVDSDWFLTSFNPSKPCGAWGNAGALLTDDPELATRAREIRNQGGLLKNDSRRVGTNGWIDPIQALVVSHKLPHLKAWTKLQRTLATSYWRSLEPWQLRGKLRLPPFPIHHGAHTWFRFIVQVPSAEGMKNSLEAVGIHTERVYSPPLHKQPLFSKFAKIPYPGAEQMAREGLMLPLFADMTGKQLKTVVERLGQCLGQSSTSFCINP